MKIAYLRYCFNNYDSSSLLQKQHTKTALRIQGTIYQPPTCRAPVVRARLPCFLSTISRHVLPTRSIGSIADTRHKLSTYTHLPYGRTCRAGIKKLPIKGSFYLMAPTAGLEPATNRLTADCSTTELSRNGGGRYRN